MISLLPAPRYACMTALPNKGKHAVFRERQILKIPRYGKDRVDEYDVELKVAYPGLITATLGWLRDRSFLKDETLHDK